MCRVHDASGALTKVTLELSPDFSESIKQRKRATMDVVRKNIVELNFLAFNKSPFSHLERRCLKSPSAQSQVA